MGERRDNGKILRPGRTELAGNHTDHQKGRVLASAVDKGIHAEVEPNFDNIVRIRSEGFEDMEINLFDLDVHPEEFGSSTALVRGVASAMFDLDARFGGFNAVLRSDLSSGSGLRLLGGVRRARRTHFQRPVQQQ